MSIPQLVAQRNIVEILHFTTNHGCLGTLLSERLKSRKRLSGDEIVEFLFAPNSQIRKDLEFIDHVSLSISHINAQFYNVSANSWHREKPIFWCILAFDPQIMAHEDVVFSTTNNIYTGVRRSTGIYGLDQLFAETVTRWSGNEIRRPPNLNLCHPTCFQAEVLYPQELSTEYLQKIYVRTPMDQAETIGFLKATLHRNIEVEVAPEKFGDRSH